MNNPLSGCCSVIRDVILLLGGPLPPVFGQVNASEEESNKPQDEEYGWP